MKAANLILSFIAIVFLYSCIKQDEPVPNGSSSYKKAFTGVVFSQTNSDSCNAIYFSVRKLSSPSVIDTIYYDTNTVYGINNPLEDEFILNPILSDSISLTINSGDLIMFQSFKANSFHEWELISDTPIDKYSVHMKVYLNGVVIYDVTKNSIHWINQF